MSETRIDPAHILGGRDPLPSRDQAEQPRGVSASKTVEANRSSEQLQAQARQLAAHLRDRQRELDHRESRLNADLAQLDAATRNAQLWMNERQAELDARSGELAGREAEIAARETVLTARETAVAAAGRAQEVELARREAELDRRAAELAERERRADDLDAREQRLRDAEQALATREQRLKECQSLAAITLDEAERLREQLDEQRKLFEEQAQRDRQSRDRLYARIATDLEEKRRALERRSEQVDRGRKALLQLRNEIADLHRATRESRLAAERLWKQLTAAVPAPLLGRILTAARAEADNPAQTERDELKTAREELETLRAELAEQLQRLTHDKREWEQWAARRLKHIERRAARLAAQDRDLQRRRQELEDARRSWQAECLRQRQELCRLRADIERPDWSIAS